VDENGFVTDGTDETAPSFFQEYKFKLEKLYSRFLTKRGSRWQMSAGRPRFHFMKNMLSETRPAYKTGKAKLDSLIK
jgi:uncharacterized protein